MPSRFVSSRFVSKHSTARVHLPKRPGESALRHGRVTSRFLQHCVAAGGNAIPVRHANFAGFTQSSQTDRAPPSTRVTQQTQPTPQRRPAWPLHSTFEADAA